MDGQASRFRIHSHTLIGTGRAAVAAAMILCALGAGSVFGQAMGKANLDVGPMEAPGNVASAKVESVTVETAKVEVAKVVEEKRTGAVVVQPLVAPASGVVVSPQSEGSRLMMQLPEILGGSVPQAEAKGETKAATKVEPKSEPKSEPKEVAAAAVVEKVNVPVVPATKPVAESPVVEGTPVAVPFKPSAIEQQPIRGRAVAGDGVAATQHAAAPAAGTGGSFGGASGAAQVGAALAIVVGLIFVGRGVARKFVPGAKAGAAKGVIEILARSPLCKHQSLVLVRIGSQIVALNQGKETSLPVLVISDAHEVAKIIGQIEGTSSTSISAGFTHLLANAQVDLERGGEEEEEGGPSLRVMKPEALDEQLDEMAAAKRQLMELRQHVRSVRDSMPR